MYVKAILHASDKVREAMALRVLFFHGLESGCGGRKHRFLQEHYEDVVCVDMHMSLWNVRKRNGILRNLIKSAMITKPWNLYGWSVQCSLDGCLQCQQEELSRTPCSEGVLIGSSWGGAVASLAIAKGLWKGPAILIAPAYTLSVGNSGAYDPAYAPAAVYSSMAEQLASEDYYGQVIIVHGTEDDTVPISHSREMARAIGVELLEVEGGDHRMKCLLEGEEPELISLIQRARTRTTEARQPASSL